MTVMQKAMDKTIKDLKNKLKADSLRPEVKKALEIKIEMLEGRKPILK